MSEPPVDPETSMDAAMASVHNSPAKQGMHSDDKPSSWGHSPREQGRVRESSRSPPVAIPSVDPKESGLSGELLGVKPSKFLRLCFVHDCYTSLLDLFFIGFGFEFDQTNFLDYE
jgi:hypothetical protein